MTFFVRCRLFLGRSRSGLIFSSAIIQIEERQNLFIEYIIPILTFLKDNIEHILNFSIFLSFLFIFFNIHRGLSIYFVNDINKDKKIQKWNSIFKSVFWFSFLFIFSVILYFDYLYPSPFPFNVSSIDCKRSTKFILAYILGTLSLYINYHTFGTWSWRTLLAIFSLLTTTLFLCMFISEPFASIVRVEIVKWGMCLYLLFRFIQLLYMELVHLFNTGEFMMEGGIILKLKSQWNNNFMIMGGNGNNPRKSYIPNNILAMDSSSEEELEDKFSNRSKGSSSKGIKKVGSIPWKKRWEYRDAKRILELSSRLKTKPDVVKMSDADYLKELAYSHFTGDTKFQDEVRAKMVRIFNEELRKLHKEYSIKEDRFKDWGYYYKSDNFYNMLAELKTNQSIEKVPESSSQKIIKEPNVKKVEEPNDLIGKLKRLGVPVSESPVRTRVGSTPTWSSPGSGVGILWGHEGRRNSSIVRGYDKIYKPVERSVGNNKKTLSERWDEIMLKDYPGYKSKTGKTGPIYTKDGKVIPFTTAGYEIFTPIAGQEWWPRWEGRSKLNQFPNCIEAVPVNRIVLDWAIYLVLEKIDSRLKQELDMEQDYLRKFRYLASCPPNHPDRVGYENVNDLLYTTEAMLRGYSILNKYIDMGLTEFKSSRKIHLRAMHDWRHNYIYRITYGLDKSKHNISKLIYNMFIREHWKDIIYQRLSFPEVIFYTHVSENIKEDWDVILDLTLRNKHDLDYEYDPGTLLIWDKLITSAFQLLSQFDDARIIDREYVYQEFKKKWNSEVVEMDNALRETKYLVESNREDIMKEWVRIRDVTSHWRGTAQREKALVFKLGKEKDDSDYWVHEILPRERRLREASFYPNVYSRLELEALQWLKNRPTLLKEVKHHNDALDFAGARTREWDTKLDAIDYKLKNYEKQIDNYHPFYSLKKDIRDAFIKDYNEQTFKKKKIGDQLMKECEDKHYKSLAGKVRTSENLRIIENKKLERLIQEDQHLVAKALSIFDYAFWEDGLKGERELIKKQVAESEKEILEMNKKTKEKLYIRRKRQWRTVWYWENIGRIREARLKDLNKLDNFVQKGKYITSDPERLKSIAVKLRKVSPNELHNLLTALDYINIETLMNKGSIPFMIELDKNFEENVLVHLKRDGSFLEKKKYLGDALKEMAHEKFIRHKDLIINDNYRDYLSGKEKSDLQLEARFVFTYENDKDMLKICQEKLDNIIKKLNSYKPKKKEEALSIIQNICDKHKKRMPDSLIQKAPENIKKIIINKEILLEVKKVLEKQNIQIVPENISEVKFEEKDISNFEDKVNILKALTDSKGKNKMIESISDVWNQLQEMTPESRKQVLITFANTWAKNIQEKEELMKIVSGATETESLAQVDKIDIDTQIHSTLSKDKIIDLLELLYKNWENLTPSTKKFVTNYLDKLESAETRRGLQVFLNQVKSKWTNLNIEKRKELLKVLDLLRTELRKEQLHSVIDKFKGNEITKKCNNLVLLNNIKENVTNISPEKLKDLKVLLDRWEKKNKLDLNKIKERFIKLSPEKKKAILLAYKDMKTEERLKIKKFWWV
jgi:hypothetical protein